MQTRWPDQAICLDCLLQVVSTARSDPTAQLERAEWMQRSGFRPEQALRDPDALIEFMHWCERRFPERCTQVHLDELFVQVRGFIASAQGDDRFNSDGAGTN